MALPDQGNSQVVWCGQLENGWMLMQILPVVICLSYTLSHACYSDWLPKSIYALFDCTISTLLSIVSVVEIARNYIETPVLVLSYGTFWLMASVFPYSLSQ